LDSLTLRIAVITPFLDRRHGTERILIEQLTRFAEKPDFQFHIYAQRLEDLPASSARPPGPDHGRHASLIWHKVPAIPGPHLFAYIWWFLANQFCRWRDRQFRGLHYDLVYSPGINAWDADAIAIHIVFHEFYRRVRSRLKLRGTPLSQWPRRIHRRLYYSLIMALERRIYRSPLASLAAVSSLVSRHLNNFFERSDSWVIPNAVDTVHFTPEARFGQRARARHLLGLNSEVFVLLLIGNDWEKKGLATLLDSMAGCRDLPLHLLVVGTDDRRLFLSQIERLGLTDRVQFELSKSDVLQFYAAADLYTGPSLEDSFALPPLEAMACGLPVITSINNGGSQVISDSVDGYVLTDPRNSSELAVLLRKLYRDSDLRARIGQNAARTAKLYNWDRNAAEMWEFLMATLEKKRHRDLPGSPAL
jgi:glycosyltransferase involved in cell wall biosynthesis